jgi:hypothetical protein
MEPAQNLGASPSLHFSVASTASKTRPRAEARTQTGHFRPLPKEFRHDGFQLRQIAREGDAAIYSQTWSGCPDPAICFEVILVKRREIFEIDGRFVQPAETYPASKLWGKDGFTFSDKDAAFAKLREF